MIYSEHVVEHLTEEEAVELFAECFRILEAGGFLRIGVPDAEIYLRAYAAGDQAFFDGLLHLGGAATPLRLRMQVINQMFRMGGHHRSAWDYHLLSTHLQDVGFDVVRSSSCQASRPEICLDDPGHAFETLYVEARKPGRLHLDK